MQGLTLRVRGIVTEANVFLFLERSCPDTEREGPNCVRVLWNQNGIVRVVLCALFKLVL